ncbi:hypothetical protein [Leptolyngbya sp. 'hensonii']|uniref:hypothetical protein n=1 Tax=Leptolyngbya sp. 'hensonii' TaxID=1922337 RepID=UPI0015C57649|nr:hypothetical protein [Leptolyngbya sp. 'hensonii']
MISELLEVCNGTCMVRVSLQVDGTTLVTSLAGADTVEVAEDRARIRAMAMLDIAPLIPYGSELQATTVDRSGSGAGPANLPSLSLSAVLPSPAQETNAWAEPISPTALPQEAEPAPSRPKTVPILERPALNQEAEGEPAMLDPKTDGPVVESAALPPVEQRNSPPPIDMSDVIAQTTVEIKRLGWSDEQGRQHLKATYGKRSRQHLTDEELLDFLHYLQAQPSP